MLDTISTLTHPHLEQLRADADAAIAEAHALRQTLTDEQLAWKPAPEVWSVLECLKHVNITNGLYLPRLRDGMARARPADAAVPFRPGLLGRFMIRTVSPENARKVKTFRTFKPLPGLMDVGVVERFVEIQEAMKEAIRDADGLDLNTGRFASPVSPLVRFTVGEGLTMLVRHALRHLGQARRVTEHPQFPRA